MTLQSVLIKPVGSFCNLRCDYCFYLEKSLLYDSHPSKHLMTEKILEELIKNMFACTSSPTFIWHGGEPTLIGLNFFIKAVVYQKYYSNGKSFANAIQTNGMLLDDNWANFLRDENFLVGISIDGPKHLHDIYRKDNHGKGTFETVFEKAKMLLSKGVQVNILATVNNYSVKYITEIYNFFVKNGFNFMQFNPVVERDKTNPDFVASYSVKAKDYGRFLCELFDLWIADFDFKNLKQKTSIRFFDSLIRKFVGMTTDHCIFQKKCGNYLVCEHNGDIFSCDYLVSKDTYIGNLNEISLNDAFYSSSHIAFANQKAELGNECKNCKWIELCYGGCIKDRTSDPQDKGHNHFCISNQYFFKKAESRLKKLAMLYHIYYKHLE
ncbi:MAG: anaerobic sulfatase maturase [Desulfobacterales bacterium]|nr:anaerobic sulfatase maturase [Desulfobacterales bacterium]